MARAVRVGQAGRVQFVARVENDVAQGQRTAAAPRPAHADEGKRQFVAAPAHARAEAQAGQAGEQAQQRVGQGPGRAGEPQRPHGHPGSTTSLRSGHRHLRVRNRPPESAMPRKSFAVIPAQAGIQ